MIVLFEEKLWVRLMKKLSRKWYDLNCLVYLRSDVPVPSSSTDRLKSMIQSMLGCGRNYSSIVVPFAAKLAPLSLAAHSID